MVKTYNARNTLNYSIHAKGLSIKALNSDTNPSALHRQLLYRVIARNRPMNLHWDKLHKSNLRAVLATAANDVYYFIMDGEQDLDGHRKEELANLIRKGPHLHYILSCNKPGLNQIKIFEES